MYVYILCCETLILARVSWSFPERVTYCNCGALLIHLFCNFQQSTMSHCSLHQGSFNLRINNLPLCCFPLRLALWTKAQFCVLPAFDLWWVCVLVYSVCGSYVWDHHRLEKDRSLGAQWTRINRDSNHDALRARRSMWLYGFLGVNNIKLLVPYWLSGCVNLAGLVRLN